MNHNEYKGHAAVLGANIIFGLFSPISKSILSTGILTAYSLTVFRMAGAAIAFWIISLFLKREKVTPKDMLLLFFASLFGIVFNQGFFLIGVSLTSPINATIIATTAPIFAMIIAAFYLKEPVTGKKVTGVFVGAMGALTLILTGQHAVSGSGNIGGDLFCLLAELCFATYLVVFKKLISRYSPVTLMKWMFLYASLCCIPFAYNDLSLTDYSSLTPTLISEILFVVLGATFLAYLLIPIGQKTLRPTVVGMYTYVQPLVASLIAVILGLDTLGWTKGCAILLVFLGVYIVTQSKSREQMEREKNKQ